MELFLSYYLFQLLIVSGDKKYELVLDNSEADNQRSLSIFSAEKSSYELKFIICTGHFVVNPNSGFSTGITFCVD